ncbi:dynamin family protein [Nocardia camponoti]|uniref:Isoniazid-inducible protein iniA n=1 Tax=Nocardia camponoti TaxID=1616106 RepID=A0A917QIK3_9NOCA|nr:dynamin family protein [Nocardia camponoti]GGK52495.1 isoniazid-inducible protein iniA [Nocardia camponoti]
MDTLLAVLDDTIAAATAAGRADLVARLTQAGDRVRDPRRRIVVAGQVGQGKSSFINALLNVDLCPVGDGATTTVPIELAYAPTAFTAIGEREIKSIATITRDQATRIDLGYPSDLLKDGIVLIDTPGLGAAGSTVGALELVSTADAILFVTDASTELTAPELAFLRQASEFTSSTAILLTKTDLYPHWRQVEAANRTRTQTTLIPISAHLRKHAMRFQDPQLGAESGFPQLFDFLREVINQGDRAARSAVARELHSAAEHLALKVGSELVALRDPKSADAAVNELHLAKSTAQDLQRRTATWQQTLADGITDLIGDVDHDLRERLRTIAREGDEWIDTHDPGRHWPAVTEWLSSTVDSALGDNLLYAHTRADLLADQIAEHFQAMSTVELPAADALNKQPTIADLEPDIGLVSKMLVGMRGSYGGVLMVGLATTFAGLAMLNPISLGAGLLVGGKAYRDDKQARLARRRAEAKQAIRRFLDDVAFQAAKDGKDRMHRIHRTLRDHYAGVAERTFRSIEDSLRAASDAATTRTTHRTARIAALESQLAAVAELRTYATAHLEAPSEVRV